jgi:hypothetical protein
MAVLRKMLLILFCACLIGGCYEDEAEIILNPDGSGTVKERLVISERLIVATSEGSSNENTPPVNKEKVLEQVGSAIDISSITQTELPDGGRTIEFEGTFSSAEQFFLSEFCRDTLKLRISPAGKGKAAIYCDMEQSGSGGPNLTQLYGMAKGLHISRTVHLSTEVEKTNGHWDKAKNTVSWAIDLRNKSGLAKTKQFIEGPDKGSGFAVFNASELKFSLPLKVTALPEKAVEEKKVQKDSSGLVAEVTWVSVQRAKKIDGTDIAKQSYTEIGIELSWNEDHRPIRHNKPVLLSLLDDLNEDLVTSEEPSVFQGKIYEHQKKKEFKLKEKAPSKNARKLKNLEGYVEVITDVVKELVVLENIQELVGQESTRNPILDKLNFRIKSIQDRKLGIAIDENAQKITSIYMIKDDGSKVKKRGSGGWAGNWTFDFDEDISKLNKCELEVVVSESMVKIPFCREEIPIP